MSRSPSRRRSPYSDAIEKVRFQHRESIASRHSTIECPMCGTKQVVPDTPGMRRCMRCGHEFRPKTV
jgi:ribosomal protein L37AE/L43A